jgi:hypothetical protein
VTTTTTQQHIGRATQTGQDAMSTALRGWAETAQTVLGLGAGERNEGVPSPDRFIDTWYEVAEEALAAQREFTKALLSVGVPVIDAMSRSVTSTIEATQEATEEATRQAAAAPQESSRASRNNAAERKDG